MVNKNGVRVSGFGSRVMALVAMLAPCALFAGNWTLSSGTLTSESGEWVFTGASRSGANLTIGACTSAASDGILDFRNTVVGGNAITTIIVSKGTAWGSANIKEFYCDTFNKVISSLFSGNTTLEKFCVSGLGNNGIESSAFKSCTSLREVNLGSSKIGGLAIDAFNGCSNLDMDIADLLSVNISGLATRAFQNCSKLHGKLVLHNINSFSSAGSCFSNTGIEDLLIDSENASFTSFSTAGFTGCKSLTNVVLKSTKFVSLPLQGVFSGCTALKTARLELPNLRSCTAGNGANRLFNNCSSLSEVTIASLPWKDASDNDLTDTILTTHVLPAVSAVAGTTDAPKKCTIYALRSEFKRFASEMTAKEKNHAPRKCYGVYADTSGNRKAYMVQDPDYKSGFIISAK